MLKRFWELLQAATAAPDDQIVIGIQEVPASQAVEMGKIMPDVGAFRASDSADGKAFLGARAEA